MPPTIAVRAPWPSTAVVSRSLGCCQVSMSSNGMTTDQQSTGLNTSFEWKAAAGQIRSGRTPSPWVTHPDHRNSLSVFWLTIPGDSSVPASVGCGSGFHSVTLFPDRLPWSTTCSIATDSSLLRVVHRTEQSVRSSARRLRNGRKRPLRTRPGGFRGATISGQPLSRDCNIADHGVQGVRLVLPAVESRRLLADQRRDSALHRSSCGSPDYGVGRPSDEARNAV